MSPDDTLHAIDDDPVLFAALAVLGAVVILAVGTIEVPYPLPTEQSPPYTIGMVGVFLAGLLLGPVWGTLAVALTLLGFEFQIAVLSPTSPGFDALLSPLGGYFLFPVFVAGIVGWIVHRGVYPKPLTAVPLTLQAGALVVGVLLYRPLAATWLGLQIDLIPLGSAVIFGGLWYLPGEALQAATALAIATGVTYTIVEYSGDSTPSTAEG